MTTDHEFAMLKAQAAKTGYALHRVGPETSEFEFIVTRWGYFISLVDRNALDKWLVMVTGKRAA